MQKPIKEAVSKLLEVFKNSDVSLFVGAGISIEPPANLPSVDALKWSILRMLSGKERNVNDDAEIFQQYLSTTMLELMIQEIAEIMGEQAYELLRVFSYGEPNLNHLFIAKLARHRFINNIWTTNFDMLIERALVNEGVAYQTLSTDHDFADYMISPEKYPDFLIFKLHGTVSFGENSLGVNKNKIVEPITPLKFETRKLRKYLKESGVKVHTCGFNRQVTPEDTMVGSLTRVGFGLSEWCRKVFEEFLDKSTFIVMGWSGFDLDVSPVLLQRAKNIYWLNHTPKQTSDKATDPVSPEDLKRARIEQDIRRTFRNDTEIELALLLVGYPQRDVIPSAQREISENIIEPKGHLWDLFTPTLVRELWESLASDFGPLPDISKNVDQVSKEPFKTIQSWGDSINPFIREWMLGRWFINHGEFENTKLLLSEQLLPGVEKKNFRILRPGYTLTSVYLTHSLENARKAKVASLKRLQFTKKILGIVKVKISQDTSSKVASLRSPIVPTLHWAYSKPSFIISKKPEHTSNKPISGGMLLVISPFGIQY